MDVWGSFVNVWGSFVDVWGSLVDVWGSFADKKKVYVQSVSDAKHNDIYMDTQGCFAEMWGCFAEMYGSFLDMCTYRVSAMPRIMITPSVSIRSSLYPYSANVVFVHVCM